MQKLIIAGTVGKDAVLRRTQAGEPVLGFSLAVDNGKDKDGNDRPATWFDCNVWGKRGEGLSKHITKGSRLTLSGRPTARCHEDKAYLGINVDDVTFQGGGQRSDDRGSDRQQSSYDRQDDDDGYQAGRTGGISRDLDDDIPFTMEWR